MAALFVGTEFSNFVVSEGLDGYALMEIVTRKDAFERMHPDWSFAKFCRLITELTRTSDNVVVIVLPLVAPRDEMRWFKARLSVFDRLSISYGEVHSVVPSHVHELRGVKLTSVVWKSERRGSLTFKFIPGARRTNNTGDHLASLPGVAHIFFSETT